MTDIQRTTVRTSIDERDSSRRQAAQDTPSDVDVARRTVVRERTTASPTGLTIVARVVTLLFGVLQVLLGLRIVLLVLGAERGNDIVAAILNLSLPFVEPFRGMFNLNQVAPTSGSVLDIAAVAAIVGWTLVEAFVVAILQIASRGRASDEA